MSEEYENDFERGEKKQEGEETREERRGKEKEGERRLKREEREKVREEREGEISGGEILAKGRE